MEVSSLCLLLATLSVAPDRLQFFRYDRIFLSCVSSSSGWTVRRGHGGPGGGPCHPWGTAGRSGCTIEDAYESDSGEYWCESPQGGCSSKVNLTVTAGALILEAPALGVMEGEDVTLRCLYKQGEATPTSDFSASFLKDGRFIGTEPGGTLTLRAVSTSGQGLYSCRHPSNQTSPESWLSVRARRATPPPPVTAAAALEPCMRVICGVLLFLLYNALLVFCIYTYRRWRRARNDAGD